MLVVLITNLGKSEADDTHIYRAEVSVNRETLVWEGKVYHRRDEGAAELLRRLVLRMEAEPQPDRDYMDASFERVMRDKETTR